MVVTGAWFGLLEMRHINFSLFFLIDKVFLDLGEAFDVILGHPLTTCWCFQHFYNQWKILFGMDSFPPSTSSLWTLWKGSCSWPRSVRDLDSCLRATDGGAGWNRPGGTRLKSQELAIDQAYSGKVDFTRGMWETAFGDQKSSCASTWVRTLWVFADCKFHIHQQKGVASRRADASAGTDTQFEERNTPGSLSLTVGHLRLLQAEEITPTSECFSPRKFHFISFVVFSPLFLFSLSETFY